MAQGRRKRRNLGDILQRLATVDPEFVLATHQLAERALKRAERKRLATENPQKKRRK